MKKISLPGIKYFLFFAAIVLLSQNVTAQKKDAYELTVQGVKVIVQPSNNELISVETVIKGGVQNYTLNKQGIESLAMTALTECGTKEDSKNSFKNKLDKVSAYVYGSTDMDYSTISLDCIKSDLDVAWPLYVAAITTPRFDEKEFIRVKQDALNNLRSQASQPDYAIYKLAKENAFKGRDYEKIPEGTEKSLAPISAAETKAYYTSILTRSRLAIVIVGEIEKDDVIKMVSGLLESIPQGKPFTLKKEMYLPKKKTFK